MKINYLKLSNIGPYVGEHTFSSDTNSEKNIILIGGKNGAGKTTFLKAIKYGLFGSFSLGLKTDTAKYFEEIRSFINNKAKDNIYIEISFDFIEDFETKNYILQRRWLLTARGVEETVSVKNGTYLDEYEVKELLDKLRAITSPQLINSFIYDGEKISSIIEEGKVSSYLEETFNSIFSIDLLNQTIKDIDSYLNKRAEENNVKEQIENVNVISKIYLTKEQVKIFESELADHINKINNLKIIRKTNYDNYFKLGGINKVQQERLEKALDSYRKEKDLMSFKIKNFIETDLPLFLNINMLQESILQSRGERQSKYPNLFKEIECFLGENFPDIEEKIKSNVTDCKVIHDLTENEMNLLEKRLIEINSNILQIKPFLDSKHMKTDEYQLIKRKLAKSENIAKIEELLTENAKLDSSITNLEKTINDIQSRINDLNTQLALLYSMYDKMTDELKKSTLYDYSFNTASSLRMLTEKYKERLKSLKLKKVSSMALSIFNDTIRKENFITNIAIDNKYNLILKNNFGIVVDPKTLSAGEMQILVSSLIWSMFKISGRREMFIFDTPLARLDSENRTNFITKIISTISSQVVILSTDSEFVDINLKAVEDLIYKQYILEYDVKNGCTNVIEGYFR